MSLELESIPDKAIVVRRGRDVVAACWLGPFVRRPYIYPLCAPRGVEVTRLGHPGDPISHSHHRSIWVAHHDVNGVDFWSEGHRSGRIAVTDVHLGERSGERVDVELELEWQTAAGELVAREKRGVAFAERPGDELILDLSIELRPATADGSLTLGVNNFGLLGVRVAKTIRVHEKLGGLIQNSEEAENEAGCFGQHAAWCDYSGPVPLAPAEGTAPKPDRAGTVPSVIAGVACFDHPSNSKGGTQWHVRDDGWMGPSLTRTEPRVATAAEPVRARYRIEAHAGRPWSAGIAARYAEWARGDD